jgi:hypothetical protein
MLDQDFILQLFVAIGMLAVLVWLLWPATEGKGTSSGND